MEMHFNTRNRDIEPACVVRAATIDELSAAVKHIAKEHALRAAKPATDEGLFAIRCSGANPTIGVAGVKDGVLLDLSLFKSIEISEDKKSVVVGGGCLWKEIYKVLDEQGLAVVGGRSSPVGIGGSTLGGGTSFYSGHYGFMCSNVISYTLVLADGTIATASATENPDLWRALKGGLNNFGVVASFTLHCFPGGPVWAGYSIIPSFGPLNRSMLQAYYDYGMQASTPAGFDPNVSTPIVSFVYLPDAAGLSVWSMHLSYTLKDGSPGSEIGSKVWPEHWRKSPFHALRCRLVNNQVAASHLQAVEDLGTLSILEQRNMYNVTGFRLDLPTMQAALDIFQRRKKELRGVKPGGTAFCMVFQTLNPLWYNKGDKNVLGLEACKEPLVVLELCINWKDARHDELVRSVMDSTLQEIEDAARRLGTWHRYKFTNYANAGQKPLEGYGEENLKFLRDVSRKYDPKGLFQTGCHGGFKLGREDL
ncbi:uncharacterized protein B0I36DRAFT_338482 [Microdochium trichocladiopsis]|uniref:FAD-binding PCMH-type domain-containing protein n=1 Tax=Microdochium trichocladiopsis TaxID=1682393 RepID=A0A9P8XV10_9PEZI|nr:uncharacterized protein B0I36DRAFT_338482 [Microdochium trichocladiopsis]KAH7014263.1 hypothetical protein B0I36DRAFT_338482 [Microdochium trichocladiopsis]